MDKQQRVKKELEIKETDDKVFQKESLEGIKVRDFIDTIRELTGLVKDSCINSLRIYLSICEASLEIMQDQTEHWITAQREQAKLNEEIFSQFRDDIIDFWAGDLKNQIGNITSFQKNYYDWVIKTSDKFMKESLQVTQRTIEQTFINFDQHLKTY